MNELPSPSLPLVVEDQAEATVVPTTLFPQPRRPFAMKMGVFDRHGGIVRRSLLWRSYGRMGFPADDPRPAAIDRREVVFAGHLPRHFGHFILEGLSRLWFARQRPDLPIAWACPAGEPDPGYSTWMAQILEVVGIANEACFITRPTRFARVHVPQAGYRVKDFCADQQAAFLAAYPPRPRRPELRIWLSRSGLRSAFESLHAARLERQLTANGWTIVQPERLPIRDQLELLATAVHVAGEEGSAFHLLALLGDVSGLRVDIICRRPDRPVEQQNHNYQTVADARGLEQRLHVMPEERVLGVERGHVRKVATTLAGHLEALGVDALPHPAGAAPATPTARLVSALAAGMGASAYLEVGSGPDAIHAHVAAPVRDVVRPRFTTDPRRAAGDGLQLYEMSAGEFFACCADLSRRYDLIVLDGDYARDELLELLVASRRHAGPGTIWLVLGLGDKAMRAAVDLAAGLGPWLEVRALTGAAGTSPLLLSVDPAGTARLDALAATVIGAASLARLP